MNAQRPPPNPAPHVLVVDDEKSIRVSLKAFLDNADFQADVAENVQVARERLAEGDYAVVISDIVMPGASGVALLKEIHASAPDVPVIMMTGEPTVETASEAVRTGASDYLSKPVSKDALLRAVRTAADTKHMRDENRRLSEDNRRYQENLEDMVEQRTAELNRALEGAVRAMAMAVESRDPYTAGHQQRVAALACAMASEMDLTPVQMQTVHFAGSIHDLGKLCVPADILSKPSKLTAAEFVLIRAHPRNGFDILSTIDFPWPIAEIVLQHHERLDGSGYPRGLAGDAVAAEARILAVADTVEAMANDRPYRLALGIDVALAEIIANRAARYGPAAVDACVRLFREQGFTFETSTPEFAGATPTDESSGSNGETARTS